MDLRAKEGAVNPTRSAFGRSRPFVRRSLALVFALIAALALSGALASAAKAGTYKVIECYAGVNETAPDNQAAGVDNSYIGANYDCDGDVRAHRGLSLYAFNSGQGPLGAADWFSAPPGTTFSELNFDLWIGPQTQTVPPTWQASICASGAAGLLWCRTSTDSQQNEHVQLGLGGMTQLSEAIGCSASWCMHQEVPGQDVDWVGFRHLIFTVSDPSSPTLSIGGPILSGAVAHGTRGLDVSATDAVGGGLKTVTVNVNGQRAATPQTACPGDLGGQASRMVPCARDFAQRISLDTTRPPWHGGDNTLRVCVADFASQPSAPNAVCEQRTISVDNSCADSSGAVGQADSISAGLEDPATGRLSGSRAVRSIDGVSVKGELAGAGGMPVRGASVCIYETVDEPAGIQQLVQVAKTRSDGSFGVQLPPGPSKVLQAAYRFGDQQIQTQPLRLDSSVKPTLAVSRRRLRNGKSLRFFGSIPGPNADGRAVALQARVGKKWRTFKELTTAAGGSFRGKYRFTQTHGRARYAFRVLVKKQSAYPYSEGASDIETVVVSG